MGVNSVIIAIYYYYYKILLLRNYQNERQVECVQHTQLPMYQPVTAGVSQALHHLHLPDEEDKSNHQPLGLGDDGHLHP